MKKYLQIVLTVILTVIMSLSIASCSSDDDESTSSSLVGSWQECDRSGTLRDDATEWEVFHLTFAVNGTGTFWAVSKGKTEFERPFRYTCESKGSSGSLTIVYEKRDDEEKAKYSISGGILTITGEDDTIYYKKVSK